MGKLFTYMMRCSLMMAAMLFASAAFAQDKPEMADTMRSNGKIYVVVAVALTIMLGLIGYVFAVDRKVSRLERELKA